MPIDLEDDIMPLIALVAEDLPDPPGWADDAFAGPPRPLDYFRTLGSESLKTDDSLAYFQQQWLGLAELDLTHISAANLSMVLYRTARAVSGGGIIKGMAYDFVQANFDLWPVHAFLEKTPDAQSWANTLTAQALLDVGAGQDYWNTYKKNFLKTNPTTFNIAAAFEAFEKMRFTPSREFCLQLEDHFYRQPQHSGSDFSRLWRAQARLGLEPSAQIHAALAEKFLYTAGPSLQNLANAIYALAIFDMIQKGGFKDHAARIMESCKALETLFPAQDIHTAQHRQIYHAALWFDWPTQDLPLPPEDCRGSDLQTRLRSIFKSAGLARKLDDQYCAPMEHQIDLSYTLPDGRTLWVEIDGSPHFVYDEDMETEFYNGSTVFQSALLLKLGKGAKLLRLSDDAINALRGMDLKDRTAKIHEIVEQVAKSRDPHAWTLDAEELDLLELRPSLTKSPVCLTLDP